MKLQWIKSFFYSLIVCVLVMSFTGCHRMAKYNETMQLESMTPHEIALLKEIEHSGIQVIRQGMVFTFLIPTDCFFTHDTHELKRHRPKDLARLALFMRFYSRYYQHPHITVTGHTDKVWNLPERNRLSLRYAEIVADYLRQDEVNPDSIFVSGAGAEDPVASNGYPMAASFNRRVVVVME